jgi:ankyrin repeat protein
MHHFVQGANGSGYFRPALSQRHAYWSSQEASSLDAEVRATELGGDGSVFGVTALMLACRCNHPTCVRKLLEAKASHEIRTPRGVSVLSIAAEEGYDEIVTMLLRAGAQPNIVVSGGGGWQGLWSPLMIVTFNGHESTTDLLLNHGADINYADENGSQPPFELRVLSQQGLAAEPCL